MDFKKISVLGLGYIGLPTAAVLASRGVEVIGVDVLEHVVETINRGEIHIVEPDLDMLVHASVKSGHLRATTVPEPADAFVVAVPTPFKEDHKPDISYIEAAAEAIAPVLAPGNLVILESTSPVGATEAMMDKLAATRPDLRFPARDGEVGDVFVAHCPERVLPGRVIHELVENDRIIGGVTGACAERARSLYQIFVRGECLLTDCRTAEMAKLTENAFRDVNIAFANELSLISDRLGINVWELIRLANRHPRVNILQPGPGVGGHCIAVDPWFIVDSAPEQACLIQTARQINNHKPEWVMAKAEAALAQNPEAKVACLGLAFKADIDDMRESPALFITRSLESRYPGRVLACEPHLAEGDASVLGFPVTTEVENIVGKADIILLLVDHKVFKQVERALLAGKVVIDTRGIWQ
jgi:UDP-N-acetyl-D-mannosaminuronic acid dehydrogenase